MSFRLFIYYCCLCGAWAAFAAWGLVELAGIRSLEPPLLRDVLTSLLLGLLLAAAVGAVDALFNAAGPQRFARVGVSLLVGLGGGLLGGLVGGVLYGVLRWVLNADLPFLRVPGWMLVGAAIGASVGVYDCLAALASRGDSGPALRKVRNGVLGGVLGGFVGGVLFEAFLLVSGLQQVVALTHSSLAAGLVIVGLCVGLLIGLAQVILKEAWVRIESGRRAGKEVLVAKDELTIGRAESCDIGIFGDAAVEKLHARIRLKGNHYLLEDADTPGGTFVNDRRVAASAPLRSGDLIRVGNSLLRFGERQKRK
jgi:hypothetical protein